VAFGGEHIDPFPVAVNNPLDAALHVGLAMERANEHILRKRRGRSQN
jgi:hypothetical protein